MRYEPGVQTGMIKFVSFGTFKVAGTCMRISTSRRCVQGFGIETVNEMSDAFGAWAPAVTADTIAQNTTSDSRRINFLFITVLGVAMLLRITVASEPRVLRLEKVTSD